VRQLYGRNAEEVLKVYKGSTSDESWQSAMDLASARFIRTAVEVDRVADEDRR